MIKGFDCGIEDVGSPCVCVCVSVVVLVVLNSWFVWMEDIYSTRWEADLYGFLVM